MEAQKSRMAESLLEVLKENQKTVNQIIKFSSEDASDGRNRSEDRFPTEGQEYSRPQTQQQTIQQSMQPNGLETRIVEVLEKMSELIELNKVTLQTIDLLDKRIKRLHTSVTEGLAKQPTEGPIEGGTSSEYTQ